MELFKYCRSDHMRAMQRDGAVRLGTLFDWRKSDQYGELVTDENEGYTRLTGNVIFYDTRFLQSMTVDSTISVNGEGESRVASFTNHAFHTNNHFAFSASTSYSVDDHRRWFELEGYDACYRIHSARLFFKAISFVPEVLRIADFVCHGPVHYYDELLTNHIFRGTFHPALVKRSSFGSQYEYRSLWKSKCSLENLDPLILSSTNAKRYVSEHRILKA